MQSRELVIGRTFGVVFDHGEDFFLTLSEVCQKHGLQNGYVPIFIAGFSSVELVGTCERISDPRAPLWSRVSLENVEAVGGGTIAYDETEGVIKPHIHVAVGLKGHAATGHTSHLLAAEVQFLTELLLVEVRQPSFRREKDASLYDVPLLRFLDS